MHIDANISIPKIWGDKTFEQDEWGNLNFLIGPNGTGKSLFADKLEDQIHDYQVRHLNAERLSGMETQNYNQFARSNLRQGFDVGQEDQYRRRARRGGLSSDAYLELREKPDLRIRIQAILSEFFGREIELEVEGGYLQPQMRDSASSDSYDLREDESHGLKELISLLTLIHNDDNDVMILDEPELHLHPQYQRFLLQQIRKIAGHPDESNSKAFFLITHSPSMIEFRDLEDLTNVYSFRSRSEIPYSISEFDDEDEHRISKLLPRLNTRHKEILFSRRPILVEGYTDEEIYSLVIEMHPELTDDPESAMIGVGGKDDLEAFFRFFRSLGLQPKFIADLDMIFSGKLRQTISDIDKVQHLAQESGLDSDILSAVGEAKQRLNEFVEQIEDRDIQSSDPDIVQKISESLESTGEPSKKQYLMLRGIQSDNNQTLETTLDEDDLGFVQGRIDQVISILDDCGYHVLQRGELEDYLKEETDISTLSQDEKSALFERTRERLLEADSDDVSAIIGDLAPILESISTAKEVDLVKYIEEPISDWMHDVQWAVRKNEVESIQDLREHDTVGRSRFARLFTVEHMEIEGDQFTCQIQLDSAIDPQQRSFEFTEDDGPASVTLASD